MPSACPETRCLLPRDRFCYMPLHLGCTLDSGKPNHAEMVFISPCYPVR